MGPLICHSNEGFPGSWHTYAPYIDVEGVYIECFESVNMQVQNLCKLYSLQFGNIPHAQEKSVETWSSEIFRKLSEVRIFVTGSRVLNFIVYKVL